MRSLAEFIMKGRRQAIIAVVLIGAIPLINFISPAVVGLVILRKGVNEAAQVLLWALLPITIWALYPVIVWDSTGNLIPVFMLLSVSGLAVVLRSTESWQITVLVAVAISLLFELYLRIETVIVDILLSEINPLLEQNGSVDALTSGQLIAVVAAVHAGMAIMLLMWSRWMQAMLFNPGGFGIEFQNLRIGSKAALALVLLILLSGSGVIFPDTWILYFVMPLLFSGTALVHATITLKQLSPIWLFLYYAVFPVIAQFLVLFALIDSWYDFRKNMRTST